jgi:hypothetical protein
VISVRISGLPNESSVEQLAHRSLEADPVQDVAVAGVDDIGAAARLAVLRLDVVLELESLESAVSRQRSGNQRVAAPEGKPAGKSRTEGDALAFTRPRIDAGEIATAGIEHP